MQRRLAALVVPLRAKVEGAVERVRPVVQLEGGDLKLVHLDEAERVALLAVIGACADCSDKTALIRGVEREVKRLVPELADVRNLPPEDLRQIEAHLAIEKARGCLPKV